MTAAVITMAEYRGLEISFSGEGWFNATLVAEHHGKRLQDWLDNKETDEYRQVLVEFINHANRRDLKPADLVRAKRGRNGGTWLHPDLGVVFARWLDPRFGVWCDQQIKNLMRAQVATVEYLPGYHALHDLAHELAAGSPNEKFVHMNLNKLVNKTCDVQPGTRPTLPPAMKSRISVAQEVAARAMESANDHHDGYEKAKEALGNLGRALRVM